MRVTGLVHAWSRFQRNEIVNGRCAGHFEVFEKDLILYLTSRNETPGKPEV